MKKKWFECIDERKLIHIVKNGIFVFLLVCIILALSAEPRIPSYRSYVPDALNEGWVQVVDGEAVELESVRDVEVENNGDIILERTLPRIQREEILLFYSQNQEIEVSVDGILIYEFVMQEQLQFLGSPGNLWNEVPLDSSMSGRVICIEIKCTSPRGSSQIENIYLTHNSGKLLLEWEEFWLQSLVGVMVLLIAIWGFISGKRVLDKEKKRRLLLTADLYLWTGIWVLAECGCIDTLFRRPVISYIVSMIAMRIIPVVFLSVLMTDVDVYVVQLKRLRIIMWVNLVMSLLLQFVCGISFLSTMVFTNLLILISSTMCGIYFLHHIFKERKRTFHDGLFLCCFLIFIGGMSDLVMDSVDQCYTKGIGVGTCVAMLVFTGSQFISYVNTSREIAEHAKELEHELDLVRYSIMAKQMNAHFLNNTLNAISALCKVNPLEADRAIKMLSKYLRANMYLIEQEKAIPFQKEMELVNSYLSIEKIRFEERFEVEIDIQFWEFKVPPLSIQPIIENAIVHGFKDKVDGGKIVLKTEKVDDLVKISIEDNGVGFLPKELEKGKSLGLKNVQKRLKLLANGTIEFYSKMDEGTRITFFVPVNLVEDNKEV